MKKLMETVKPSMLRQYFWEYAVIGLTGAVVTLFLMFNDLNRYVRDKQNETILKVVDALNKSTNTTDQFLNNQKFNK